MTIHGWPNSPTNEGLPTGMTPPQSTGDNLDAFSVQDYIDRLFGGLGGGGSSMKASDVLAREKWQSEIASAAEARRRRDAQLQLMRDRLQSGAYRGDTESAFRGIGEMESSTRSGVENIYGQALRDIGAGYDTASNLTNQGYAALADYLSSNQQNPYEGLSQQMTALSSPMDETLQAYGIEAPEVAQQLRAESLAGQQGAQAFQSLVDVLSGAQRASMGSRGAEMEMARQIASQRLGSERGLFESRAGLTRQGALSDLARWVAEQRFAAERDADARRREIEDELVSEGFDPAGKKPAPTRVEEIAATAKNLKAAAKQFAPKYMAENPKATPAQIAKKFPKLAAAVNSAKAK